MSEFYDELKKAWGFTDGEEPPRVAPDIPDRCPKCDQWADKDAACPDCGRPNYEF